MAEEHLPPQALEAEAAVLGAMLLDPEAVPKVFEFLDETAFYSQHNRKIFDAIKKLFERNVPADMITVADELKRMKEFENVGGATYLSGLVENILSTAQVEEHAKLVLEKATGRKLIQTTTQILQESFEGTMAADDMLDRAEQLIFQIKESKVRRGFIPLRDILQPTVKEIEKRHSEHQRLVTGVETGLFLLDEKTSGLQNGDFIIVAGRPSMGKTALALNIAAHSAVKHNLAVAIFSLEMTKESVAERLICAEAEIPFNKLRSGKLSREEWTKLTTALGPLFEGPIYIDDSAALPILELKAKARRLKAEVPLGLLVIDYIQLIQPPRGDRSQRNRQQEISDISQALKALAKELNLPVVAVSQLSRLPERRDNKKPELADLRESGALEQDADLVLLLFREAFYNRTPTNEGLAEFKIAKQRNGPTTDWINLAFLPEYMRFENLSFQPEPDEAIL
jgi:replicative DNA helicase